MSFITIEIVDNINNLIFSYLEIRGRGVCFTNEVWYSTTIGVYITLFRKIFIKHVSFT